MYMKYKARVNADLWRMVFRGELDACTNLHGAWLVTSTMSVYERSRGFYASSVQQIGRSVYFGAEDEAWANVISYRPSDDHHCLSFSNGEVRVGNFKSSVIYPLMTNACGFERY
jgi:hypothetical protein